MKKTIIRLIALIILVILPFAAFVAIIEKIPNQYSNTYLAEFDEKYNRLYEADGKKIVFIGGSSLPFGLRSDLIEEELGGEYTVINYGLYATLGTKLMMDTAIDSISEGDIIILCPELNAQTYSLYFNPSATLEACDGFSHMLSSLPLKDKLSVFYNYYKFAFDKLEYAQNDSAPDPIGIYRSDSFNEYGDLSVERKNNIMNGGYDSNLEIKLDSSLLNEEFMAYVNKFTDLASKRGATVYFNYSPVNHLAIRSSKLARAEFEAQLSEKLDCQLLGSIEDYLIDERYFYDTNFHLNSAGAVYFSRMLTLSLKEMLGMEALTAIEIPEPPALEGEEAVTVEATDEKLPFEEYLGEPNNDYLDCFIYELKGKTYTIVGVNDEYLGMTEVILPSVYDGKNITAIASNAFMGCTDLVRIHIGLTYKSIAESAFAGCISLDGIYLYELDGNLISPHAQDILKGAAVGSKIYIPQGANYSTGYTWTNYTEKFEYFTKEANR